MNIVDKIKALWLERKYPKAKLIEQVIDVSVADVAFAALSFTITIEPFKSSSYGLTTTGACCSVIVDGLVVFKFRTLDSWSEKITTCLHRGDWCWELNQVYQFLKKQERDAYQSRFVSLDELKRRKRRECEKNMPEL